MFEPKKKKKVNILLFAIPAVFDQMKMSLRSVANVVMSASIVHMLSSTLLIYVAILTVLFLKKNLYRHHWTSIIIIVVGICIVGLNYLIREGEVDSAETFEDIIIGIVVL